MNVSLFVSDRYGFLHVDAIFVSGFYEHSRVWFSVGPREVRAVKYIGYFNPAGLKFADHIFGQSVKIFNSIVPASYARLICSYYYLKSVGLRRFAQIKDAVDKFKVAYFVYIGFIDVDNAVSVEK